MIGILLMSHGRMAEGMLNSCKLFFGEDMPQIEALCLEGEDVPEEFDQRIVEAVKRIDDGSGVIALCDLFGGTPCNRSALLLNEKLQVITGMSLTMLIELLGKRMMAETLEEINIQELIETSRNGIIHLNTQFKPDEE